MKNFILFVLITSFIFLFTSSINSQEKSQWKNLKYALYFTNGDIEQLLSDSTKFNETMKYFTPIKIEKVYLEGKKSNNAEINLMRKIAERFRRIGITPIGAMVPTSERGGPMCYNNQEDMNTLERRMRALASIFDEIILDDWLFTICTCDKCLTDRGNMSWADYRTQLIIKQSKKYIIEPAKEVNPNVKIIIKYPNWYEGHRQNGYDVYNETNLFDKMAVGIET